MNNFIYFPPELRQKHRKVPQSIIFHVDKKLLSVTNILIQFITVLPSLKEKHGSCRLISVHGITFIYIL